MIVAHSLDAMRYRYARPRYSLDAIPAMFLVIVSSVTW